MGGLKNMLKIETVEINGRIYTKTFSDKGYYIIDNQFDNYW